MKEQLEQERIEKDRLKRQNELLNKELSTLRAAAESAQRGLSGNEELQVQLKKERELNSLLKQQLKEMEKKYSNEKQWILVEKASRVYHTLSRGTPRPALELDSKAEDPMDKELTQSMFHQLQDLIDSIFESEEVQMERCFHLVEFLKNEIGRRQFIKSLHKSMKNASTAELNDTSFEVVIYLINATLKEMDMDPRYQQLLEVFTVI